MSSPDSFSLDFQLPDFLDDDALMKLLFALSQSESHNPNNWVGLREFWEKMILKWVTSNRKLMFNEENLKKAFGRKGKYPASLNKVLDKMEKYFILFTWKYLFVFFLCEFFVLSRVDFTEMGVLSPKIIVATKQRSILHHLDGFLIVLTNQLLC